MTDDFQSPLRGDTYVVDDHKGVLHLFYPTEYHSGIPTKHGEKDCIKAHIVLLDGPNAGTILKDAVVWGSFMVPQLKGAVGGKAVLGRVGQGQNTKGNPPWVVLDPTEEDKAVARQWTAANGDPRVTEVTGPPPTSPVSQPTATGGGNPPGVSTTAAPISASNTAAPTNGASAANPADLIKLAQNNIPAAGLDANQIALLAATL